LKPTREDPHFCSSLFISAAYFWSSGRTTARAVTKIDVQYDSRNPMLLIILLLVFVGEGELFVGGKALKPTREDLIFARRFF